MTNKIFSVTVQTKKFWKTIFANAQDFDSIYQLVTEHGHFEPIMRMFRFQTEFNESIEHYDVSKYNNFNHVFSYAENFNQPLARWNISSARKMVAMFEHAHNFNQPIGNWDVSNVHEMHGIFHRADAFNQDLSNWTIRAQDVKTYRDLFNEEHVMLKPENAWKLPKIAVQHTMRHVDINGADMSASNALNIFALESRANGTAFEYDAMMHEPTFFKAGSDDTKYCASARKKLAAIKSELLNADMQVQKQNIRAYYVLRELLGAGWCGATRDELFMIASALIAQIQYKLNGRGNNNDN